MRPAVDRCRWSPITPVAVLVAGVVAVAAALGIAWRSESPTQSAAILQPVHLVPEAEIAARGAPIAETAPAVAQTSSWKAPVQIVVARHSGCGARSLNRRELRRIERERRW